MEIPNPLQQPQSIAKPSDDRTPLPKEILMRSQFDHLIRDTSREGRMDGSCAEEGKGKKCMSNGRLVASFNGEVCSMLL